MKIETTTKNKCNFSSSKDASTGFKNMKPAISVVKYINTHEKVKKMINVTPFYGTYFYYMQSNIIEKLDFPVQLH